MAVVGARTPVWWAVQNCDGAETAMSILLLGFFLGMRHAMDADHVAAVATLVARSASVGHAVKLGAVWGLGHTATLMALGAVVIWSGGSIPAGLARALELAVAAVLIGLGADLLRRLARDRIHFHVHRHRDGSVHMHAHSHAGETGTHDPRHHEHAHPGRFAWRALLVGLVHGAAGTAALTLLVLGSITSPWLGALYIGLFGLGSILGMAALSLVIAVPLRHSARRLTRQHHALQAVVAVVTIGLGMLLVVRVT